MRIFVSTFISLLSFFCVHLNNQQGYSYFLVLNGLFTNFNLGFGRCRKMIKLFKVKEKQREIAENAKGKPPVKKQSAGELRLHKGIARP